MKAAALTANIGLLLVLVWYLLTTDIVQVEGVEWAVLALVVTAPLVSILALVRGRIRGGTARTMAIASHTGLLAAIGAYFVSYYSALPLEGRELLLFGVMLSAPCVSIIALLTRHAADKL